MSEESLLLASELDGFWYEDEEWYQLSTIAGKIANTRIIKVAKLTGDDMGKTWKTTAWEVEGGDEVDLDIPYEPDPSLVVDSFTGTLTVASKKEIVLNFREEKGDPNCNIMSTALGGWQNTLRKGKERAVPLQILQIGGSMSKELSPFSSGLDGFWYNEQKQEEWYQLSTVAGETEDIRIVKAVKVTGDDKGGLAWKTTSWPVKSDDVVDLDISYVPDPSVVVDSLEGTLSLVSNKKILLNFSMERGDPNSDIGTAVSEEFSVLRKGNKVTNKSEAKSYGSDDEPE